MRKSLIAFVFVFVCLSVAPEWAQQPAANPPKAAVAQPLTPALPNLPHAQDVIGFLNDNIDWYRQLVQEEQAASDPSDVLFVNQNRQTALEVLRLAFDFARADAQLSSGDTQTETANPTPGRYQALTRAAKAADTEAQQTRAELDADKQELDTTRGKNREQLQATVDELQSELNLAETRSQTLHQLLQFVSGTSGSGGNLAAQIDQLEHSIPELQVTAQTQTKNGATNTNTQDATANTVTRKTVASGAVSLVEDLFSLRHRVSILEQRSRSTDALTKTSHDLRAPLLSTVTQIADQGEQAAKQADTSDAAQLQQIRAQLNSLNTEFKQVAAVLLPLSKQQILFNLYKANLLRWRDVIRDEYSGDMRRLLIRLGIFAIVVVVLLILSQMWRRAVFRYVHDPRRRYQFLLLRRIVVWCVIGITIAFALANEIGSIATFAGLITAGIAVALQNVIMAIAGYFFLIGKYGVRVGDRVQISGVTGDVIDIGLIRLHLMELGGSGIERQPTGRVVVFSNAVVFQPTASFYKQIPGTNFVWHEVSLTLAPESDYGSAEKRVLGAVEKVYAGYREDIEAQYREMERTLNVSSVVPKPRSQLRVTQAGLEIIVRYPVTLGNAMEIDDRVTRELLQSLNQPPKLKLVGTGTANIQPVEMPPEKVAS